MRYTLKFYRDDMGSFMQPGCRNAEDALWHVNKAREHDNLPPLTMDDMNSALKMPRRCYDSATLIPEDYQ